MMNALGSLKALYGTMRMMIIVALVVAVVGAVLIVIGMWSGTGVTTPTTGA